MLDTTEKLMKQIVVGEDSALGLRDLRFKGNEVSGPHSNSMADELAAMANTFSGVFVLGVDDKTRTVSGIPDDKLDVVENWLRHICNGLIEPPLVCRIRKIHVIAENGSERPIIRIDVPRSLYVHQGYSIQISKIRLHMFSDRMELFSPGAPPSTITIDSLPLRQASRNELLTSLLARCPVNIANLNTKREFMMDKRGEGVPIILTASEKVSGRAPEYQLIDDAELLLTIFAAHGE